MSCSPGIPNDNYESLMFWAQRHKKSHQNNLLSRVEKIYNKNPELIRGKVIDDAKKFHKIAREVALEFNRLKGFLHFKLFPEMVLFGEVETDHDIIDLLLNFFIKRFPEFFICLQKSDIIYLGTYRKDVSLNYKTYKNQYYRLKKIKLIKFLDYLKKNCDKKINLGQFTGDNWIEYYNSQYIESRKNIKLAKKTLPLKLRNQLNLEHEFNIIYKKKSSIKPITDYFE